MSEKVDVENVNAPGRTTRVDRAKYEAARDALMAVLPAAAPGMTPAEAQKAMVAHLPEELFPGGEKVGWWMKCVQLDLEAKRVIVRGAKPPVRLWRV